MDVETIKLDKLKPDPANARKHSERNLAEIERSLREFGQHAPLVVQRSTGRILVGNGRYEAMKRIGWPEAQVLYVDDDNVTAVRRALADNRTAELAAWDSDVLKDLIQELGPEPDVPGWSDEELEGVFSLGEVIDRDEDGKSGASPWDRIGDADGTTVLFSFGDIQSKLSREVFEIFRSRVPDDNVVGFLEELLT